MRTNRAVVTTTTGGLTRHYHLRKPGLVARTWMSGHAGTTYTEIVLWRLGARTPTYQGAITRAGLDQWTTLDHHGKPIGHHADFIAAEDQLLAARTGRRSHVSYEWPDHLTAAFRARSAKPTCRICGQRLVDGFCSRYDLHW